MDKDPYSFLVTSISKRFTVEIIIHNKDDIEILKHRLIISCNQVDDSACSSYKWFDI